MVRNELSNGFAIIRPPGHHAEADEAMGFCMYNNVAVAAQVAREAWGVNRVLILDWDIHHGNGTQHMFDADPQVLYSSLHRWDRGASYKTIQSTQYNLMQYRKSIFSPVMFLNLNDFRHLLPGYRRAARCRYRRGWVIQEKRMRQYSPSDFLTMTSGAGFSVNVPWPHGGMGDSEYSAAFHHLLMPIFTEFNPELVLISAGFDSADGDPLGGCKVTPAGFAMMTKHLMRLAGGKVVVALEGGYNLQSISVS